MCLVGFSSFFLYFSSLVKSTQRGQREDGVGLSGGLAEMTQQEEGGRAPRGHSGRPSPRAWCASALPCRPAC